uniref:Secreted protein n=1 Tax=Desmodus rotundus TaxID=9430 RepID=K9IY75_DESRO
MGFKCIFLCYMICILHCVPTAQRQIIFHHHIRYLSPLHLQPPHLPFPLVIILYSVSMSFACLFFLSIHLLLPVLNFFCPFTFRVITMYTYFLQLFCLLFSDSSVPPLVLFLCFCLLFLFDGIPYFFSVSPPF